MGRPKIRQTYFTKIHIPTEQISMFHGCERLMSMEGCLLVNASVKKEIKRLQARYKRYLETKTSTQEGCTLIKKVAHKKRGAYLV